MTTQYKGRTYTITYEGVHVKASWRGYSALAFSVGVALETCHRMIEEINESDDEE